MTKREPGVRSLPGHRKVGGEWWGSRGRLAVKETDAVGGGEQQQPPLLAVRELLVLLLVVGAAGKYLESDRE